MNEEKKEENLDKDSEIAANRSGNSTDRGGANTEVGINGADLNQKRPKSQRAGLNAIRPDDYIEKTFKDLAKDRGKSQTELFEAMFWNYINKEQEKEMEMAVSFKSEINLISNDLDNILSHFKSITEKAQNTIIVDRNNANQKIENLQKELETAELKNKDLTARNKELETSNEAFTTIREDLTNEVDKLRRELDNKEENILALQKDVEENNILISKYGARITELEAILKEKDLDIRELKDSIHRQAAAAEQEAEKGRRADVNILDLKQELKELKKYHKEEMNSLEKALILKYEAEKNMAIVDIKLQLIDIKNELQEKLIIINKLKEENGCQTPEK